MKIVSLILIITIIACNNKQNHLVSDTNEHLKKNFIKQYFQTFNKHSWDNLASFYDSVAEFKDPTLGKGIVKQTKQQIIEKYTELNKYFPNLKDSVTNIYIAKEDNVIVEFISTGKSIDGITFELPICTIFNIKNGKIMKDFNYFDNFEEPKN